MGRLMIAPLLFSLALMVGCAASEAELARRAALTPEQRAQEDAAEREQALLLSQQLRRSGALMRGEGTQPPSPQAPLRYCSPPTPVSCVVPSYTGDLRRDQLSRQQYEMCEQQNDMARQQYRSCMGQ